MKYYIDLAKLAEKHKVSKPSQSKHFLRTLCSRRSRRERRLTCDSTDNMHIFCRQVNRTIILNRIDADMGPSYAGHEIYGGNMDGVLRAGAQVAQLDPLVIISAMAAVTDSVSFGVTGSTSYIAPFPLARTFSSLDHLTDGRIAWNVVTSWSTAAANAFGLPLVPHDKRYEIAEEYMDVTYK